MAEKQKAMATSSLSYKFCARTDQGRVRGNNEDAYALDDAAGLAVLADGMGGYNAGEVASSMACTRVQRELSGWFRADDAGLPVTLEDIRRVLERSVAQANSAVLQAARDHAEYAGMGTTLVVGVFHGGDLILGHIGDSRCYRLRDGELVQITRDHSLLQEQLDAGLITPEQAAVSTHRNLVTRALGVDPAVLLEVHAHQVEADDLYLMCSDGLSDMLRDGDIASLLRLPMSLELRAQALIDMANERGGRDNITVMLVRAYGPQ